MPDDVIDKVLTQNRPLLWSEARRVVVANCVGNVAWALWVANEIITNPKISAGSLIDADTLKLLVGDLLTGDDDFLAISALALFSRYGVDRELSVEMEQISSGLDIPLDQLVDANRKLERLGLVAKHGRYRSVAPHPLAVFLATRAWEELGDRIFNSLLPAIDDSMVEQLFLRAADLGSSGPAAVALNRILGRDGPFRSLESIAQGQTSRLLIQLAIISPEEVVTHLTELIDESSDEELRSLKAIRRNLVWTLEKLVWHSATFEVAASGSFRAFLIV